MSSSSTNPGDRGRDVARRRERIVGAAAIGSALLVLADNTVVAFAGAPSYAAPLDEVLAFHAAHRGAVGFSVALEALNGAVLLGFLVGLHGLVRRRGGAGGDWARLAVAAGATFSAVMALFAVLWEGVVLHAAEIDEPDALLQTLWRMHAAAFAWSLPALGVTLAAAAWAAYVGGLTPRWQHVLGLLGGALSLVAGAASLAIADGSALISVGVLGLGAWVVWLLASGTRLVRGRTTVGPAVAPGDL